MKKLLLILTTISISTLTIAQCNVSVPPSTVGFAFGSGWTAAFDTAFFCAGISMNVNGNDNAAFADPYVTMIIDGNSNTIFVKEFGDVTFNGDNNTIYVEANVTTQDNGSGNQVINCPGNQAIFDLTNAPSDLCNYSAVEELQASFFEMYPNPSTESFTIELTNQEDVIVSIFNNIGQLVYSEKYLNENRIDLTPNIPIGLYTVTVSNDSFRSYSKLVMSR